MAAGIEERRGRRGQVSYRAEAYIPGRLQRPGEPKSIRKTFDTRAEAKAWLVSARAAIAAGTLRPSGPKTVAEAIGEWLESAEAGRVMNRSGLPYKPSTLRGYRWSLGKRAIPRMGSIRLGDVRRRDVQDLIDHLLAEGDSASTIRNALDPLRAMFRWAVRRELIAMNPSHDLAIPATRGEPQRVATPEEADALLAAVSDEHRPLWTAAFLTGMRSGELRELRWSDVDLESGVISVSRSLDDSGEVIRTKTLSGDREIPIYPKLRSALLGHKLRTGRREDELVFGRTATEPFIRSTIRNDARAAWKAAGIEPITMHQCRHTAATEMRAAGLDFKMIQTIIGHSSVTTTFDRYMHVSREHLIEAGEQLEAYYAARGKLGGNRV